MISILPAVTVETWCDFGRTVLFQPCGMGDTETARTRWHEPTNIAELERPTARFLDYIIVAVKEQNTEVTAVVFSDANGYELIIRM